MVMPMPQSLPRPCAHPGCPGLTRERYCPQHKRQTNQIYDRERGTASQRGYGTRWRRLRQAFLSAHPLCEECQREGRVTPATDVDHRLPKRRGGGDDESNLQALCHAHHSAKTAREDGRWG